MKVTKSIVKEFERSQKDFGTKTAIHNLLWTLYADLLMDLNVTRVRTEYGKRKKK